MTAIISKILRLHASANKTPVTPAEESAIRKELAADTSKMLGTVGPTYNSDARNGSHRLLYEKHGIAHKSREVPPFGQGDMISSWGWHAGNAHALHKHLKENFSGEERDGAPGMATMKGWRKLDRHVNAHPAPEAKKFTASETAAADTLLLQQGDVLFRYESMIARRKVASLAMQPRVTQRLDKEIALLRAALGLPQLPPEEVVRTHVTMRDPTASEDLMVSSFDAAWARGVTARTLDSVRKTLERRGYAHSVEHAGDVTVHRWDGLRDGVADTLQVKSLGNAWIVAALRNAAHLCMFNARPEAAGDARGVPPEMSVASWDGALSVASAQEFAEGAAALLAEVGR